LNSKLILLLGGLISSIIVFLCMKDEYISSVTKLPEPKSKKTVVTKPMQPLTDKKTVQKSIVYQKPKLSYRQNQYLNISLNEDAKKLYAPLLNELNITKDINFSKDINRSTWDKSVIESIKFFIQNNVLDASIEAFSKSIDINATFSDKNIYEKYHKILNNFKDINITDNTTFIIPQTKENNISKKKKDDNTTKIIKTEKKKKTTYKNKRYIQNKINNILKRYPIYFKFDSDVITPKGKKALNKIIRLLKKERVNFTLKVEGHSNAVGDENYNKALSQKRATAVKRYLLKHSKNIKSIIAKGYGSSKPKIKNPKDRRNRRVEIIILKGSK